MAIIDVHFQEGEGQDFILELPSVVYSGEIIDITTESGSTQYPVSELPSGAGNIFIMSE